MKTTTILITALMLMTSMTVFAQRGRGNRNAAYTHDNYQTCINVLPDHRIIRITAREVHCESWRSINFSTTRSGRKREGRYPSNK